MLKLLKNIRLWLKSSEGNMSEKMETKMPCEIPLNRVGDMADVAADAFVGNNDPIGNFMLKFTV